MTFYLRNLYTKFVHFRDGCAYSLINRKTKRRLLNIVAKLLKLVLVPPNISNFTLPFFRLFSTITTFIPKTTTETMQPSPRLRNHHQGRATTTEATHTTNYTTHNHQRNPKKKESSRVHRKNVSAIQIRCFRGGRGCFFFFLVFAACSW